MAGQIRVRVVPEQGAPLDLAVPGAVPVADLLPELARRARLTSAARLVTATGVELAVSAGLAEQRVPDGSVLALVPVEVAAAPESDAEADDPAEGIAEQVAREVLGWHVRLGRPVALGVAVLLLGAAGAALARGPSWSGAVAAAAVVLLGGAAGFALHRRHDRLLAAASGWAAVGFAAVTGAQYAGPVAACASAGGTALALAVTLRTLGALLVPAVVAAAVLGGLALLGGGTGLEAGLVAALGLSGAALLVPALPRLALAATRERPGPARELLRAMLAATGVVMVVLAAPTAAGGGAGAALAAVVGLLAGCRGSRHHGAVEVITGIVTGVAVVLVAAVTTTLRHPAWSGWVGIACLVVAGAAGASALSGAVGPGGAGAGVGSRPTTSDPRLALAADRVEALALVALVPLLVVVAGVLPLVTGLLRR